MHRDKGKQNSDISDGKWSAQRVAHLENATARIQSTMLFLPAHFPPTAALPANYYCCGQHVEATDAHVSHLPRRNRTV